MEVIVTEEKKKIFRARKTMKISDRQQLESLHSTLLTVAPGLSNPSPPPLMNGTHKEDGQKVGDKEQNNILDLNTPQTTPPVSPTSLSSPAPSLTLNLSPSPPSSSPKASEENTAPRSPMDPLNFELKKVEEDEKKDGTPSSSLSEPVTAARTDCKGQQEKDIEVIPAEEKKEEEHTVAQDPAVDLAVDSVKGSVTPVLPAGSDFTEPMETDSDTTKETDPQAPVAKVPDEKLSSPRGPTSDSSSSSPSHSASSCTDRKQSVEIKDEDIKEEETHKADVKKGSACEEKMEVDSVKVEPKKEKTEVGQTAKPSRPSSTPPSDTVKEERSSTSGLKRTLSEGSEKDGQTVKIEGKRPKMEREELEAQLELKITTKAGSHHKLGKIVQQLVEERLKVLELTIFDKHFQELKDRVDKIDCATKHQAAINTLQAKIARLSKKFGEANQASENKRKQEALAAVAAAAKTAAVTNNPQAQRPGWTSMEVKQTPTTVSSSSTAVAVEECTRRDSDFSDDDVSEVDSNISDVDSVAEDMFLEGKDAILDRQSEELLDPAWEPDTRTAEVPEDTDDEQTSESEPDAVPCQARGTQASKRARRGAITTAATGQRWYDVQTPDITPTQPTFCPLRNPGSQLISTADYSALDLFQLFFTKTVLQTIVDNTNEHGRAHFNKPYEPWTDITLPDMFLYLSIVICMGFVKAPELTDYWRTSSLYSFPFTKKTITMKKFLTISRALHLSSAAEDDANERKRGTRKFDCLGKIKPLYTEIREACKRSYHPDQHISVLEQYIESKPTRGGFKLFVLAESKTGYTWDYFVYEGKSTGKGLSYDPVMKLVNPSMLGTGYKLYLDHFHTSPTLFLDLYQRKIWACGKVRINRIGYPKTKINALDSKSLRGTIRWLREDPLLFVQWRDTQDAFFCSTIHTAHGTEMGKRKIKDREGHWSSKNILIPPAVKDYNQHMVGLDLSDQLIGYYDILHKMKKWYKRFFFHAVDIAIVNAFILYQAQCKVKGQVPTHQKAFRETLAVELLSVGTQQSTPQQEHLESHHRLVHIADSGEKTSGRLKCRKCHAKTPVKCATCNMPLCFVANRDCYNNWHRENM
ncbi:activating transcription factor 7-interacting protein 1 isoform X2 [Archocentrus centrarchus]|uniref:activating transcription factor 7-interacting protein 1 isoform X2 n=1 Tax=Archocentrus centrarchus TaxID=63155 RepID=UPI0011EA0BB4|nr:activating transcription factor 7-interacting protein 1 isoform X2 [Archocentrus centrarchus]